MLIIIALLHPTGRASETGINRRTAPTFAPRCNTTARRADELQTGIP